MSSAAAFPVALEWYAQEKALVQVKQVGRDLELQGLSGNRLTIRPVNLRPPIQGSSLYSSPLSGAKVEACKHKCAAAKLDGPLLPIFAGR